VSQPTRSTNKTASLSLSFALLLGGGLRLLLLLHGQATGTPFIRDEGNYLGSALSLANGGGLPDRWLWLRPPGYIFYSTGVFALFGKDGDGNLLALGLSQVLLGLLTIWLVYLLARLLFPARAAVGGIAALLVAASPVLVFFTNMYMSEQLYVLLTLAWFYLTLRAFLPLADEQVRPHLSAAFVFSALTFAGAALTRSLVFFFLPALWFWLLWLTKRADWRRSLVRLAIYTAIVLALILPWSGRNLATYGQLILIDTTGQINLYIDNGTLPRKTTMEQLGRIPNLAERASYAGSAGLAAILADPPRFLANATARVVDTWKVDRFSEYVVVLHDKYPGSSGTAELSYSLAAGLYHLLFFALAVVGLALARGEAAAKGLLLLIALVNTLLTTLAHPEYRYLLPFLVLFAPWAGYALLEFGGWLVAGWRRLRQRDQPALGQAAAPARLRAKLLALLAIAFLLFSSWGELPAYGSGWQAAYLRLRAGLASGGERVNLLQQAVAKYDAADWYVSLGDTLRGLGKLNDAAAQYAKGVEADRLYWPAILSLGAAQRAQGDTTAAQQTFATITPKQRAAAQAWAWQHLGDAPTRLDVGVADYGNLDGFYEPEQASNVTYRWSKEQASLRLAGQGGQIALQLRASREQQRVSIRVNGQPVGDYRLTLDWQLLTFAANRAASVNIITLQTDAQPASPQDPRKLGVAVDWATVQ